LSAQRTPPVEREPDHIADLTAKVIQRSQSLLADGARSLGIVTPHPDIRFDLRGLAAGQARFGPGKLTQIRFNPLLLRENPSEFIDQTVPHECAHVLAYCRHGRGIRPHGPEWQAIMLHWGAQPERCHRFDVSRSVTRRVREFDYHCDCREHRLSTIRHRRVLGGQVYLCRHCAGPLRPGAAPKP
jgi:SprT protein